MKRVKVSLVFVFLAFWLVAIAGTDRFSKKVHSGTLLAGGPPAGVSGAPGESTCNSCHDGGEGAGLFVILAPAGYTPGQTYQVQVRHTTTNTTRRRWGFELTALTPLGTAAGTFQNLSGLTQTLNESGRFYVEHTLPGTFTNQTGGAVWTFNWTAPATDVGTVTFYAAGNQANNNSDSTGDEIYVTTTQVPVGGVATPTPTPTPATSPTPTPTRTPTPTPTPTPVPTPTPTPTPSPSPIPTPTPTPTPSPTPSPSPTPTPAVTPTPTPTPVATASITGRVLTPDGRGIRNAIVTLIDSQNVRTTATTSSFGVYTFNGLVIGQPYIVTASVKRYRFTPLELTPTGNMTNVDFFGLE